LAAAIPKWAVRKQRRAVLPCGVDLERFTPISRTEARQRLGLQPTGRYLLFPADPARPEKRYDRARTLADNASIELLTLGNIDPAEVPFYVNAANAVLVPSERESFGLAVLEALACNVPVLATPVGIAPEALAGVSGTLCAPYDKEIWRAGLAAALDSHPQVDGRARAEAYSSDRMAANVVSAWQSLT
jgi:glycosyltransferase involved in cell wall biosynthesis